MIVTASMEEQERHQPVEGRAVQAWVTVHIVTTKLAMLGTLACVIFCATLLHFLTDIQITEIVGGQGPLFAAGATLLAGAVAGGPHGGQVVAGGGPRHRGVAPPQPLLPPPPGQLGRRQPRPGPVVFLPLFQIK